MSTFRGAGLPVSPPRWRSPEAISSSCIWSSPLVRGTQSPRSSYWASLSRAAVVFGVAIAIAVLLGIVGGNWAGRRIGRQVEALTGSVVTDACPTEITEFNAAHRKLVEVQAARETSDARFRHLFELAPLPLGYVAPDGRILAINQRFEKGLRLHHRRAHATMKTVASGLSGRGLSGAGKGRLEGRCRALRLSWRRYRAGHLPDHLQGWQRA